ncbi:unnamed protein product [Trifolium pratense]|uniref:Uncharacterized protein n=1 Tax=Trifolium pratense TaxID=57577 RepID=A0ACB0MC74_TRIPR|nr:unnamed protein product [Trifolium pratense]
MDGGLPVAGDFCWRFPVSIFSPHHRLPNQLIIITTTQFLNLNNNRIFNNHLIFQHRNKMELAQLVLVELVLAILLALIYALHVLTNASSK